MAIKPGERLPDASFDVLDADGKKKVTTAEIFSGKRVVLFAVPGAFTGTCHKVHLPSFLENLAAIKAKGIDTVACTAVNDADVMRAWQKQSGADGKILFLADGNADFARKIGLDADMSKSGMGVRSRRYSMLVEDCVVKRLNVEEKPGLNVSGGDTILQQL